MILIGRDSLHNQLDIGGGPKQLGNNVGRAREETPLKKNNVCGKALNSKPQILERIRLGHNAQIVFKGKDLANTDAVNRLRIRKNNANRPRFHGGVEYFVLSGIVQEIHSGLPILPGSHCSANLYSSIVAAARYRVWLMQRSEERRVGKECRSRWS